MSPTKLWFDQFDSPARPTSSRRKVEPRRLRRAGRRPGWDWNYSRNPSPHRRGRATGPASKPIGAKGSGSTFGLGLRRDRRRHGGGRRRRQQGRIHRFGRAGQRRPAPRLGRSRIGDEVRQRMRDRFPVGFRSRLEGARLAVIGARCGGRGDARCRDNGASGSGVAGRGRSARQRRRAGSGARRRRCGIVGRGRADPALCARAPAKGAQPSRSDAGRAPGRSADREAIARKRDRFRDAVRRTSSGLAARRGGRRAPSQR